MKYDKTYSPLPAKLTLSHSLSNVFHLFSLFATEISEVLALFRRGIEPAWRRSRNSPIVNGPDVGIVKNAVYVRHTDIFNMLCRQMLRERIKIIANRLNNF